MDNTFRPPTLNITQPKQLLKDAVYAKKEITTLAFNHAHVALVILMPTCSIVQKPRLIDFPMDL